MNLYDVTRGDYHVSRTFTYPDFPNSKIVFDTDVTAPGTEWSTQIRLTGSYDAPTEVVGVNDYNAAWTTDGKQLFEEGTATLRLANGNPLGARWSGVITPKTPHFDGFPRTGESIHVDFSSFTISGNTLTYDWHGTVTTGQGQKYSDMRR